MAPFFSAFLGISIFVTLIIEAQAGYLTCNDQKKCCRTPVDPKAEYKVRPVGQCLPLKATCPYGTSDVGPGCGVFSTADGPKCGTDDCIISYATLSVGADEGSEAIIVPGSEISCVGPGETAKHMIGQRFSSKDCAKNYPNKNFGQKKLCSNKEYCCREYAGYYASGNLRPGLKTVCQAVGTGCPAGYQGSNDQDCNLNWPNMNEPPLPPLPQDCSRGQYTCIEYTNIAEKRKLPGIAVTCQNAWEGCPSHYQGFPTNSFKGNWPNRNLQPLPPNCGPDELCCMDPAYTSQSYNYAYIGGMGAECRPKGDKTCKRAGYVPINSNQCSKAVPFFAYRENGGDF